MRKRDNINNLYIELHANYPTENKELLLKREGEVMRDIVILNKVISGRSI